MNVAGQPWWVIVTTSLIAAIGVLSAAWVGKRVSKREADANFEAILARKTKDLAEAAQAKDQGGAGLFSAANEMMRILMAELSSVRSKLTEHEESIRFYRDKLDEVLDHKETCEAELANMRTLLAQISRRSDVDGDKMAKRSGSGEIKILALVGLIETFLALWIFGRF